jgi:hypothetical protein
MITIVYLLASLLLGASIGLGVYWRLRNTGRAYRVGTGVGFGLLAMLAAAVVLLSAASQFPAVDDERFAGQSQLEIIREAPFAGKDADARSRVRVLLAFPSDIRKDYDFTIHLVASASPALSSGEYRATLSSAKNVEIRPIYVCPEASSDRTTGVACATYETESEIELRWDVTPSAEGRPRFVLTLPTLWPPSASWTGHLRIGGLEPAVCSVLRCSRQCGDTDAGHCGNIEPVLLSPQRPRFIINSEQPGVTNFSYRYDGVELDLVANTMSFPIEVITTLGFGTSTYAWLALAGTVASGLLGSGWIWKLLDALKKRGETARATAQNS